MPSLSLLPRKPPSKLPDLSHFPLQLHLLVWGNTGAAAREKKGELNFFLPISGLLIPCLEEKHQWLLRNGEFPSATAGDHSHHITIIYIIPFLKGHKDFLPGMLAVHWKGEGDRDQILLLPTCHEMPSPLLCQMGKCY